MQKEEDNIAHPEEKLHSSKKLILHFIALVGLLSRVVLQKKCHESSISGKPLDYVI